MVDLDNIFKFCTPKYVYIRDAKLGIMKYCVMAGIFGYVVVYQILYTCHHLHPHHTQGFGDIWMEHPVDHCADLDPGCLAKFHNIAKLPYCAEYEGTSDANIHGMNSMNSMELNSKEGASLRELKSKDEKEEKDAEEDGKDEKEEKKIGKMITPPKPCRYIDNRRLMWEPSVPSEIFIPTHYKHIKQTKDPECYDPDEVVAEGDRKKLRCKNVWKTAEEKHYYIADIEQFTLHLAHSFNSPVIQMHGISTDFQGLFAACATNHPLDVVTECKRVKVPNTYGKLAPEDAAGLSTTEELGIESLRGSEKTAEDLISFGDLLKLTPVAQQYNLKERVLDAQLPSSFGHKDASIRELGGMLMLDVDYSNIGKKRPGFPGMPESMQIKPISYMYRPYFVPTTKNSKHQLVQSHDRAKTRSIDIWYGVTIKMQFNGQLVHFSWSAMLKALTTGLVLLSMGTTVVTALAAFVLPLREKYCLLLYQMSEDFTDYKQVRYNSKISSSFSKAKTSFATGDALLSKLSEAGDPTSELSNPDIIKILAMNEMRLNRLDAMDPKLVFVEAADPNPINKAIGQLEKTYYTSEALGIPGDGSGMSWKDRLGAKAE